MGAELAILERKIDTATATLNAKVDLVLSRLDEMNHAGKPGLTQREFAKLLKKHPRTITRWVTDKKLRLEKGMVPHSEVRKFLS
jgi:hypothetical protein